MRVSSKSTKPLDILILAIIWDRLLVFLLRFIVFNENNKQIWNWSDKIFWNENLRICSKRFAWNQQLKCSKPEVMLHFSVCSCTTDCSHELNCFWIFTESFFAKETLCRNHRGVKPSRLQTTGYKTQRLSIDAILTFLCFMLCCSVVNIPAC